MMRPIKNGLRCMGYFQYVFSLCLIALFFLLQNIWIISLKKSRDRDENKDEIIQTQMLKSKHTRTSV